MTRRRNWDGGEPLFGEERWAADQRLFADSLATAAPSQPPADGHAVPLPSRSRTARQDPTWSKACCRGSKTLPEPMMNYYGEMAQRHWATWLPHQYATIEDPDSFFSDLGSRVEAQIDELADQLAGNDQPGEGYLGKAGRIGQVRSARPRTGPCGRR